MIEWITFGFLVIHLALILLWVVFPDSSCNRYSLVISLNFLILSQLFYITASTVYYLTKLGEQILYLYFPVQVTTLFMIFLAQWWK